MWSGCIESLRRGWVVKISRWFRTLTLSTRWRSKGNLTRSYLFNKKKEWQSGCGLDCFVTEGREFGSSSLFVTAVGFVCRLLFFWAHIIHLTLESWLKNLCDVETSRAHLTGFLFQSKSFVSKFCTLSLLKILVWSPILKSLKAKAHTGALNCLYNICPLQIFKTGVKQYVGTSSLVVFKQALEHLQVYFSCECWLFLLGERLDG